jgi:hypothetical protein
MGGRAAQFLGRDDLVGHGLHHVRAGDEHVARVLHHEDEVGHRRRIDRAARARAHDDGNLRDDARGLRVAPEHLGIAAERGDALLDARAARVVQADDRHAVLHGEVHHLADLLGMRLRQRAAEHGEILAEHIDRAAVDRAPAGDDAVARIFRLFHAEIGAAMRLVGVVFLEGALVEQHVEPLARRQLALAVLRVDALLPAAETGQVTAGRSHHVGKPDALLGRSCKHRQAERTLEEIKRHRSRAEPGPQRQPQPDDDESRHGQRHRVEGDRDLRRQGQQDRAGYSHEAGDGQLFGPGGGQGGIKGQGGRSVDPGIA